VKLDRKPSAEKVHRDQFCNCRFIFDDQYAGPECSPLTLPPTQSDFGMPYVGAFTM
jgi:hypothetical protein